MANNGGHSQLLARLVTRAEADLGSRRRAARLWRWLDVALLVPAAVLAAASVAGGVTGIIDRGLAAFVALGAAGLAGTSLVLDIPRRSRRAARAATYLETFVSTVRAEDLRRLLNKESVAALRRWYVRINAALAMEDDDLATDLLESPLGPELGPPPPQPDPADGRSNGSHAPRARHPCGSAAARAGARHSHRLRWAFVLAIVFLVIEAVASVVTGSLALLSDAGHVLADAVGLGLALAAIHLASNGARHPSRTFGLYRLEIVAALANAVLLLGVAGYVLVEAIQRIGEPPPVPGGVMLAVAFAGLVANGVSFWLLKPGATESLNVQGAYLDVVADALASLGVLAAGLAIRLTGWVWIDPVVGAAIGLWILPRAFQLGRDAFRIIVQAAPPEVDVSALAADLRAVEDVVDVHALHLWTLTSDMEVASAHLTVAADADTGKVLDAASLLLRDRYHVDHITLQVEPDRNASCVTVDW